MSDDYIRGAIKYTSRDYQSIMNDFWELVPKMTELWKPEADADPGVVLGKFLASAADMLGINLDILASELFAPSVSQRKNAEKLFGLIGYDLGWYTAARTEVTFHSNSDEPIVLDFGFNGANFATVQAYTDITNQARVITYNILPMTSTYGLQNSRGHRTTTTSNINVFVESDEVTLANKGDKVTRVAIEGELRSYSISVQQVKQNNYIINLPSQHLDTTAIWIKAKASQSADDFLATQWVQCSSPAEFVVPEPRFAVTYDSYSNAQVQVSNYLNQLENYENNYLTVYWIDCSGVIGCVGADVLSNFLSAKDPDTSLEQSGSLVISNLSNTIEIPHTYTVTGKSPETAKEAYVTSRNFINTWDSLITLPDFTRFLNREPGVDAGLVIDCQKALEINQAIFDDTNLTTSQKSKMYINNYDFPKGTANIDWTSMLNARYDVNDASRFISNFKTYTAMCFAIHNDFQSSVWGNGQIATAQIRNDTMFKRYKPPVQFIDNIIRDYRPLQAMSVELEFGYIRLFEFYVVGQIYPKHPVSTSVAKNIIARVKEDLSLYFAPANRAIGQKPTLVEIVKVIQNADDRIDYFDAGSLSNNIIKWLDCDIEYFNPISFARYMPNSGGDTDIQIAPEYIT